VVVCLFLYKLFLFCIPKDKKIITPLSNNPSSFMSINQDIASSSPKPESILRPKTSILLIGLDGRLGDNNPRCDAIHIITIDPQKRRVQITSIPRGALVDLGDEGMNYISNSCHLKGFDFTLKKIEQIASLKPDYIIKLGFSQSMGILKNLGFQPVETLEFLRNRRYGIGDNQRSHNQALFIKDVLTTKLPLINNLPKPVKYLLYKMTDTNLDFEKALQMLDEVINIGADQNPDSVTLVTKPFRNLFVKDIHYEFSNAGSDNLQNSDYLDYQKLVSVNLDNIITRAEKLISEKNNASAFKLVQTPFEQQFWRQIDDKDLGYGYYYNLLRIFSLTNLDKINVTSQVLDFITEMENSGDVDYQIKAKQLLETLNL
ncbi:LCP family protein, partial [Candidatus Gottesmanbacteria bacterium]|nr:LCP family protein [Candidatus Gottesmanbacteria bacterium]